MIISQQYMVNAIPKDRINEYEIVIGNAQEKLYRLRLNTNGRWFWENLVTTEAIPGFYISRPEAIDGFEGEVEVFKNESSVYAYLKTALYKFW